jgi:hypothetical protein
VLALFLLSAIGCSFGSRVDLPIRLREDARYLMLASVSTCAANFSTRAHPPKGMASAFAPSGWPKRLRAGLVQNAPALLFAYVFSSIASNRINCRVLSFIPTFRFCHNDSPFSRTIAFDSICKTDLAHEQQSARPFP